MNVRATIEIDLAEYGDKSGAKIVLGMPTFRRLNNLKNQTGSFASAKLGVKGAQLKDVAFGDLEIMSYMTYVETAPFEPTVDGWLAYADMLDGICVGNADALYHKIEESIKQIEEGKLSPLSN